MSCIQSKCCLFLCSLEQHQFRKDNRYEPKVLPFFLFSKTPLGEAMIKMGKGIFHVNNNFYRGKIVLAESNTLKVTNNFKRLWRLGKIGQQIVNNLFSFRIIN